MREPYDADYGRSIALLSSGIRSTEGCGALLITTKMRPPVRAGAIVPDFHLK
jgi:hypothetical protein